MDMANKSTIYSLNQFFIAMKFRNKTHEIIFKIDQKIFNKAKHNLIQPRTFETVVVSNRLYNLLNSERCDQLATFSTI